MKNKELKKMMRKVIRGQRRQLDAVDTIFRDWLEARGYFVCTSNCLDVVVKLLNKRIKK